jgi:cobalt/nickel transport system permease protein
LAGTFPLSYGLTVITPVEAIVGVLEGIVTVFVMNALHKVKPELTPVLNE